MSDSATKPKKLYKYEAFTEQSLKNLKAQVVYFGSPKSFNDPYDCALVPTFKSPSDSEVASIRASYLNQTLSKKQASEFLKPSTDELRGLLLRANAGAIKTAQENFVHRGISCFSEVNNELLMWSHYGGKYKGFCLEMQDQNPHVRFWKGRKSAVQFKVEFDEFTYTPTLKAK